MRNLRGADRTELTEIKEYQIGDGLRDIHWKLSSKTSELMVKDYALPIHDRDYIVIDLFERNKKENKEDEMFDLLYGLINAMTARGYGFHVCYKAQEYVMSRVETQLDIENLFINLYEAERYPEKEISAAELFYGQQDRLQKRVFYVTDRLNDDTRDRLRLLAELGPTYYLIPGELDYPGLPVHFVD